MIAFEYADCLEIILVLFSAAKFIFKCVQKKGVELEIYDVINPLAVSA